MAEDVGEFLEGGTLAAVKAVPYGVLVSPACGVRTVPGDQVGSDEHAVGQRGEGGPAGAQAVQSAGMRLQQRKRGSARDVDQRIRGCNLAFAVGCHIPARQVGVSCAHQGTHTKDHL